MSQLRLNAQPAPCELFPAVRSGKKSAMALDALLKEADEKMYEDKEEISMRKENMTGDGKSAEVASVEKGSRTSAAYSGKSRCHLRQWGTGHPDHRTE